ncbi:hypothetical protein JCM19237_249 [Photobacterium aphoticum]|uniref:Uncharacterized protein n=1 Tax=Photobacterium aphoticum TaxID=754436 RepID=A0A090R186_9GAMM|nr:hypothetical protein JCM19237_249 [Photobacterium aphoticum]
MASGAKKLISLHAKHGVHMADSFKSFLMFRIYHGMTQAQQNTRQVVAISAAQHSKNILDNTLRAQARKEREVVKPVSMPAHLSDPKYGTHKYTKLIENIRKSH